MSLRLAVVTLVLAASSSQAVADSSQEVANDARESQLDVRAVLSAFGYAERGRTGPPLIEDGEAPENASTQRRAFGDLRVSLEASDIAASPIQVHFDARFREIIDGRYQSGFVPGREYDLRESYVAHRGRVNQLIVGRQFVAEAAQSKLDGVRLRRVVSDSWILAAFAGTFPQRGSRSLKSDYLRQANGKRVVPALGGVGATYGGTKLHGHLGLTSIFATRKNPATDLRDEARVQANADGYWAPSRRLSLSHFALADLSGPSGAGIRNLSLSLNSYPADALQLRLEGHHQDSEFLEITARNQLEDPDLAAMGVVQNGATLTRISAQSLRAGPSWSPSRRRFEVSLMGGLRQRPEVRIPRSTGEDFIFPAARNLESTLTLLDRRSIASLRLSAQATALRALGRGRPTSSQGWIGRLAVSHSFAQSRAEWELDAAGMRLRDRPGAEPCTDEVLDCFGRSTITAGQAGAVISYWGRGFWHAVADFHLGAEKVLTEDSMGARVRLPYVFTGTFFLRVGVRHR
jgi:hypothetical protein